MIYDDYIYRLSAVAPQSPLCTISLPLSIDLPKDLKWEDELKWSPVNQTVEFSTTGALLIQEGAKQKGRPITLVGVDDMAWLTRPQGLILQSMQYSPGLVMDLRFVDSANASNILWSKNVMFRHSEGGLDMDNIKHFDQYEPDAWYIVRAIRFMETLSYGEQQ